MAVKTTFKRDDFRDILAAYDLGGLVRCGPLPGGTVQTNYFLETGRGKFAFRFYEVRPRDAITFEIDLLRYLTDRGYPCPAPIPDREGKVLGTTRGRPFALFSFLDGQTVENPEDALYDQLVRQAAALHNLSPGFSSPHAAQRWNYSPGLCARLAGELAAELGTPAARNKLAWLEAVLGELALPPSLPVGICHGDFHYSNVLFRDGKFAALLDFDDANLTYLAFDLVGLIESRAWRRWTEGLDLAAARRVAEIYQEVRPLAEVEREHLYDVYQLSIAFDAVWYFDRWEGEIFRERSKIEMLRRLGRERFRAGVFD